MVSHGQKDPGDRSIMSRQGQHQSVIVWSARNSGIYSDANALPERERGSEEWRNDLCRAVVIGEGKKDIGQPTEQLGLFQRSCLQQKFLVRKPPELLREGRKRGGED